MILLYFCYKKQRFGLDICPAMPHNGYINKTTGGWLATYNRKEASNMNAPIIGQSFTTQASGVTGTVQEVIKNATGSFRVRLDVNGQDRWTTVK